MRNCTLLAYPVTQKHIISDGDFLPAWTSHYSEVLAKTLVAGVSVIGGIVPEDVMQLFHSKEEMCLDATLSLN